MDTYKATNTTNGKFYIGSTTNFEKRKKDHLSSRKNYPFQNALRKNPEAFEWEVWSDDSDEPILEQALLDMWFGKECCYNLNPSAKHPPSWEGMTGYIWWNDGKINKRSAECPGEGWTQGVIREKSAKHLDSVRSVGETPWWTNGKDHKRSWTSPGDGWRKGLAGWWTNGKDNKRSWTSPGDEWRRGMTRENTYEKYWTDGKTNKRCSECPGEGWREGVAANRPSSKPVRVTTIATGEYLDFPSICAAARHYKVSDSKLGYAANGKYKQHKGLKVDFI